jgi:hypothetical protein
VRLGQDSGAVCNHFKSHLSLLRSTSRPQWCIVQYMPRLRSGDDRCVSRCLAKGTDAEVANLEVLAGSLESAVALNRAGQMSEKLGNIADAMPYAQRVLTLSSDLKRASSPVAWLRGRVTPPPLLPVGCDQRGRRCGQR